MKLGPDTYVVSSQVLLGPGKGATAREAAFREAGAFCEKQGKEILVDDYTMTGGPNTLTGDADVRFRCLAKDDPDLKRPTFQPTQKVITEQKRQ